MSLTEEQKQILEILAMDHDKNPDLHIRKGVPKNSIGARIGSRYVGTDVRQLTSEGLVSRLNPYDVNSNVVITVKGYKLIRPEPTILRKIFRWFDRHININISPR